MIYKYYNVVFIKVFANNYISLLWEPISGRWCIKQIMNENLVKQSCDNVNYNFIGDVRIVAKYYKYINKSFSTWQCFLISFYIFLLTV